MPSLEGCQFLRELELRIGNALHAQHAQHALNRPASQGRGVISELQHSMRLITTASRSRSVPVASRSTRVMPSKRCCSPATSTQVQLGANAMASATGPALCNSSTHFLCGDHTSVHMSPVALSPKTTKLCLSLGHPHVLRPACATRATVTLRGICLWPRQLENGQTMRLWSR